MSNPDISIIIPVYNVERFIRQTIESVLTQKVTSWQLILVNDGSIDASGKICDEYAQKDPRISVIHQPNLGVSTARNKGLDKANGKYICFIDGDDYVDSNYLSSMSTKIDGHDAVYADVTHRYPAENRISTAFSYPDRVTITLASDPDRITRLKIIENGFPVAKLFRRDMIEKFKLRFDQQLSYHEDHIFVLEYLSHCQSIVLTSDTSYQYRHLPESTSLSKRNHPAEKLISAANKLLPIVESLIEKYNITDRKYRQRLYTILGLNQILLALKNKNTHEISAIGNAVRQYQWHFLFLYRPNHLAARLIPIPFLLHLDPIIKLSFKKYHFNLFFSINNDNAS